MSTITLPNIRVSSDLTVGVVLKDGGVAIDWSTLSNIKAYLYADAQRAMAGRCSVSVDEEDATRLVCSYRANKPQYIGVNRIVITCTYRGETKTFDKPALNFVRWTDDQAGQQITIDDPDVDVEIEVEDVSSSILEQAIAAALQAAADAEHAAHLIPNQVLLDCEQATSDANAAAAAANAAGITSVQVSVEDNEPGTPSAECSLANKVLSIIFHYLKGETGDAAGFGTISASFVEDGGDPSVLVTTSGPDTAKNIAFTLKNFKGDKGDKGDQGNTGSSVDYPFELVNNETTDDATKAHTAAGAKRLKDEVSQLEHKVDNIPGPNYTAGKYLKANGVEDTDVDWGITDFIEYAQGNAVEWNYGSPDKGTYVIQFYDSNKTPINNAFWGAQGTNGVKTLSASSIAQYASNGVYLRASFRIANTGAYVKVGETTAWTPQVSNAGLKQRVEALELADESLRGRITKIDNLIPPSESGDVPVSINGKYIDNNGDVVDYDGYAISSPFELAAGDKIRFTLYANLVSYLCSVENDVYTPIYYGNLADTEREYEAENAITVVLCFATNHTATYSLYKVSDLLIRESALNYNYQNEETILVGNANAYVEVSTGRVVPYTGYNISAPIHLNAGETIKATFAGQHIAVISQVVNDTYTPIVESDNSGTAKEYSYTAVSSIDVALCGTAETINSETEYTIEGNIPMKTLLAELISKQDAPLVLINPYAGANFNNRVCAQSHEHCYDKGKLENSYNRGIRVIACSHYQPSTPRYPLSNFNVPYQDYKSKQAVLNGDFELVTRYTTGSIPVLNTNSGNIDTDTIPQIANAERPYVRGDAFGQHMNILGLLWGDPGHSLCNGEVPGYTGEDMDIKRNYSLESFTKFNELLEDETMWQFGSRYAFGTINHCTNASKALAILNNCPSIFKAMEMFNQGYSEGWNQNFRDAYDEVLKSGKRIWGTAVVDWQGDWATWNYTTQEEKDEWQAKFDELTAEEQAEYGNAEGYYMATGRIKHDRGTNVLLMDDSYNGMSPEDKAKEAILAYLSGRYYMSANNTKSMKLVTDSRLVTFILSDIADTVYVVTANGRTEYTGVDTINYVARADDKYIRFEAFWNNGEFVFTNPVWVEPVS